MSNSKILYDNRLRDAVPVGSTTAAGTLARNVADARPYTWWKPTALPATLTVDCDTAKAADAACIVAHNLASMGCDVQIRGSTDGFSGSAVLVASVTPSTDGPVWQAFGSVSYRYWRLRIDGPGTPAADYDFAGTGTLPAGITFTRADASTCASYFDTAGILRLALANVARFDHDPATGAALGLRVEESRTNRLIYSTPIVAAQNANPGWSKAVGTETLTFALSADNPMGLAAEYVATLATASSGAGLAVTASYTPAWGANQFYTGSIFWQPSGADLSMRLDLVLGTTGQRRYAVRVDVTAGWPVVTDQSGGTLTDYTVVAQRLPGGWWRISLTGTTGGTPPTAGNAWIYVLRGASSMACRLWGAQLEDAAAFATSYIPTTGSAVTRAADSATVSGASFTAIWNASAGTLYRETRVDGGLLGTASQVASSSFDGTAGNALTLRYVRETPVTNAYQDALGVTASVNQFDTANVPAVHGRTYRQALAFAANDIATSVDGGTVGTDASATLPTVTSMTVLSSAASSATIARLRYWPKRLTNAQLQWLTAADRGDVVEPSIAIAMIGAALTLPTGLEAPFDPIGRKLDGRRIDNNNGQPLGSLVDYMRWEQTINLRAVSWSWIRDTWLPAFNAALADEPFVFAWDPTTYPNEVRLVTTDGAFLGPHRSGSLADLTVNLRGVA
jgi:hypothetical protein